MLAVSQLHSIGSILHKFGVFALWYIEYVVMMYSTLYDHHRSFSRSLRYRHSHRVIDWVIPLFVLDIKGEIIWPQYHCEAHRPLSLIFTKWFELENHSRSRVGFVPVWMVVLVSSLFIYIYTSCIHSLHFNAVTSLLRYMCVFRSDKKQYCNNYVVTRDSNRKEWRQSNVST